MRSFALFVGLLAGLSLLGAGCGAKTSAPTPPAPDSSSTTTTSSSPAMSATLAFPGVLPEEQTAKRVRIQTTKGDIVIQLDPKAGPNAASNFVYLIQQGFYQGTIFHRVIPGFMIQGGDPTGTGFSGPGYEIPDDPVTTLPTGRVTVSGITQNTPFYPKGTIAMANKGAPRTAGSQFFIMVADYPLPPTYSVFGKVVEGQDVADAIAQAPRDEMDRPNEEIRMVNVTIE